jgi:hypothetical protein
MNGVAADAAFVDVWATVRVVDGMVLVERER